MFIQVWEAMLPRVLQTVTNITIVHAAVTIRMFLLQNQDIITECGILMVHPHIQELAKIQVALQKKQMLTLTVTGIGLLLHL